MTGTIQVCALTCKPLIPNRFRCPLVTEEHKDDDAQSSLQSALPVDEHVEEVSEDGKRVHRRGIYLLPNLFTMGALFAGFYAIVAAMNGVYDNAALAVFVAMGLDGLDGRVARMTNTQSAFGAQLDSLSDMVSFGVAPALVVFSWGFGSLGRFGWAAAFIYMAGAALRLARFNTQIESADSRFFTGLASPSGAALVAATVWLAVDNGYYGENLPIAIAVVACIMTALVGILMVTNVPYHSFKGLDFKGRVPFAVALIIMLGFAVVSIDPPLILLAMSGAYALSGPVARLFQLRKR
mgnify:CR=1 FL=1